MITKQQQDALISLIKQEVIPAIGCTEPMAVALCTARATELLGARPEKINVQLSPNILKNAMGVGIPGTGMIGLPIAIALGAIIGKSKYQLQVLKDLTPETLAQAKQFVAENRIQISLKPNPCDLLYIQVTCHAAGQQQTAIIEHTHTHFRETTPHTPTSPSPFGEGRGGAPKYSAHPTPCSWCRLFSAPIGLRAGGNHPPRASSGSRHPQRPCSWQAGGT